MSALLALATLAGALAILRHMAPQLLGLAPDLRLVAVGESLPPFYDGAFRAEDYSGTALLVNDPIVIVRGRPGMAERSGIGPHDALGFRNREVPNTADVVVLGDSQTYGSNALLEDSWPSQLRAALPQAQAGVYAMATGGWGAVQYLEMATKATAFSPQLVVVAFYTGNDALESFELAYSLERNAALRPDARLSIDDLSGVSIPAPGEDTWPVTFAGGLDVTFTPQLRLEANRHAPVVDAGYAVMAACADAIVRVLAPARIPVLFTIIPTKEFVYAPRVAREQLTPPPEFARLVTVEGERIASLAAVLAGIPGARYVDVTQPLREAAMESRRLYPAEPNGHPIASGYRVIARAVAAAAAPLVRPRPQGLIAVSADGGRFLPFLVVGEGVWRFASFDVARRSGWRLEQAPRTGFRTVAGLRRLGVITEPDRARFGPPAVAR